VCVFIYRITATLSCPMKLHKYPLDTQDCPMTFSSCKLFFSVPTQGCPIRVSSGTSYVVSSRTLYTQLRSSRTTRTHSCHLLRRSALTLISSVTVDNVFRQFILTLFYLTQSIQSVATLRCSSPPNRLKPHSHRIRRRNVNATQNCRSVIGAVGTPLSCVL